MIVSWAPADAVERFERLRDVPRSTSGFVAVPLVADRSCVGVMGIGVDDTLDDRDLGFFEAVAAQVAQTITRVRLTGRDRRRRVELEFLGTLTDTALEAADHLDLMHRVCAEAVPTLGDWCSLHFLPEIGGAPLVAYAHTDPAKVAYVKGLLTRYPYDPDRASGVPAVIRTGTTEFIPRFTSTMIENAVAASNLDSNEAWSIIEHLGITSSVTVPLRTKRRVIGAMQFVSAESRREYDGDDVALAEAVAGRVAEQLVGSWDADQQRTIAVTLQQALLPPVLPTIVGIELAARYWPAGVSRVGGDFYDVFQTGDQRWALLIGDACGTGSNAAALTGIARHTVRAAARHDIEPDEVMRWLNEAIAHSNRDMFCTACYATLTAIDGGWHLTSTAAGHPLPIIARPGGVTTVGEHGTLLGVLDSIVTTTVEVDLHPGDILVLYTDGITDLPPPYGITTSQLTDLIADLSDLPTADQIATAIHQSLLRRVPDRSRQDDVALLVVRLLDR